MTPGLLIATALLYLWGGIFAVLDGRVAFSVVLFTFFLSNMALAYLYGSQP